VSSLYQMQTQAVASVWDHHRVQVPLVRVDEALAFEHAIPKLGLQVWQCMAGGQAVPDRHDVDPCRMGGYLPHLSLFNVTQDDAGRALMRPRLIGADLAGVLGDFAGTALSDVLAPKALAHWRGLSAKMSCHRAPLRVTGKLVTAVKDHVQFESLLAPLTDGGTAVKAVYAVSVFMRRG